MDVGGNFFAKPSVLPLRLVCRDLLSDDFHDGLLGYIEASVGALQISKRVPTAISNVELGVLETFHQALHGARILDLSQEAGDSTADCGGAVAREQGVDQLTRDPRAHSLQSTIGGACVQVVSEQIDHMRGQTRTQRFVQEDVQHTLRLSGKQIGKMGEPGLSTCVALVWVTLTFQLFDAVQQLLTIHHGRALGDRVKRRCVDDLIGMKHDRAFA